MILNSSCAEKQEDGWLAGLELEIVRSGGRSVVGRSRQNGPLTIQSPFYPEGNDLCHLYLLHPPAGIVGGDRLRLQIEAKPGARALLTTPGATKFYKSDGKLAIQEQTLTVAPQGSLEWLPQETIFFPNTFARMQTTIHLQEGASITGWEINCLGLPINKRSLEKGQVTTGLQLYRDGTPLLLERMQTGPEKAEYQAGFLRDCPVFATFFASGCNGKLLDELRNDIVSARKGDWAATLLSDLLVLRYLGGSVLEAKEIFTQAWQCLRPQILDRTSCPPRIWAT